ncbi:aquaporin-3-like isoform X2 [Glandiceps talaboti]
MGAYANLCEKLTNAIGIKNQLVRECLAEFIGTFILLIYGDGSVAQNVLSRGEYGEFLSINWAWGIGVTMAVYFAYGVSGAHINPAVTLAMSTIGRFPWYKLPLYMLMQFLGAFLAAACVYGVYYDAIDAFDGGVRQVIGPNATAGIFATYPKDFLRIESGLGDQIFSTMLLVACIMAITDKRNTKPPSGMEPLLIGLIVFVIGLSFGFNCGYAINPARDFGPRLFTYCAGYGSEVWTPNGVHWWWVPIVGPFIGGICGALVYITFVEAHHPKIQELELDSEPKQSYVMKNVDEEGATGSSVKNGSSNPSYEIN